MDITIYGEGTLHKTKREKKYRTKKSITKHCSQYKTLEEFAKEIQTKGKWADYIAIAGVPFTMEEYDEQGKIILWTNKKLSLTMEVNHKNRYTDNTSVTGVYLTESLAWRNDVNYLE